MELLIFSNDVLRREKYRSLLNSLNYHYTFAADDDEAFSYLSKSRSHQFVVLDCGADSQSDFEFCRRLRRLPNSDYFYLALVAKGNNETKVSEYLNAGADDYLLDPFTTEQIAVRIQIAGRLLSLRENQNAGARKSEIDIIQCDSKSVCNENDLIAAAVKQSGVSMLLTTAQMESPNPKLVFVNSGFSEITGYLPVEVIGKSPRFLHGAKINGQIKNDLREESEKDETFSSSAINYRKNKSPFSIEWQASPVKNNDGQITHFFFVQKNAPEQKQKETLLREARQYQQLFNLVNDAVIVFDPESFKVLIVNEKACEIYRVPREAFIGQTLIDFWRDAAREQSVIQKLLNEGRMENFETEHTRPDGTLMNVQISSSLVEYEGKQAILSVKRDITERRLAEQGMKRAKQEWSDTVDAVSDMIILEDTEGNLRRCNKATSEFFKLPYLELIGKPVSSLIQRNKSIFADLSESLKEHLRQPSWEGQICGRAGWYEIMNHLLPSGVEGKSNWVHIIKDITERRHTEAERQRLYTAIEQAADAILITDPTGLIQYVNSSFERQTGWCRSEAVGREISEIKKGLHEYEPTEEIFSALLNGDAWQKTYRANRRSGDLFDEQATISLVRDAEGNPLNYVFVCRDVTETRRLESIAEAVNMMDNVGYIFSGIRHELGNPINSVKTALTVLNQNLGKWESDQIKLYIDRCLTETARVEYLLRTLKTFSMHENPQMQRVALMDYMQKFVSLVGEDFEQRNIKITLCGGEDIGEALCDPRALHQVMLNLLANSADSFDEDGQGEITISITKEKKQLYVNIADSGCGMSESQMNNLFRPFYTSKVNGNGLGLVIVRSMLGKMNGTISVKSLQHVGTTVIFTLERAIPDN